MRFLLSILCITLFSSNSFASFQSIEEAGKWLTYYYNEPDPTKTPEAFSYLHQSGKASSFQSVEQVSNWVTYYYKNPEPNIIPEAFRYISLSKEIKKDSDIPPLAGFLAGALKSNPDKAESWIERLSELPVKHKRILILGVWYSELPDAKQKVFSIFDQDNALKQKYKNNSFSKAIPCSVTQIPLERGPWVLDILWGNFMATGSKQPVARIITALSWFDKHFPQNVFMVGAAAKWSLISNAKQHERVLKICIEQSETQPQKIADELREIIHLVNAELSHTN